MKTIASAALALVLALTLVVPALAQTDTAGDLPREKLTIKSAVSINMMHNSATLPLHKGMVNGMPVWFVITDVSDAGIARDLGVNFAPKLAHVTDNCPGCAQMVTSTNPVLGRGDVTFKGMPDFSPNRLLLPGPTGFPPLGFRPGGMADPMYSPYVKIEGSPIVYNAPIVATGNGPFDVMKHTNIHDRVLAIDTGKMTVEVLFIRGFANGKNILYLSFESSDALTAVIERSTFTPALTLSPFPNGSTRPNSARTEIFTFVNGAVGRTNPPIGQGQMHVVIDGLNAQEATLDNTALMEALRAGGDARNVFEVFPTLRNQRLAQAYSPLWDLNIGVWSPAAVARKINRAQTDAARIRALAAQGLVTNPGGLPLSSANILINCPALAFTDDPPRAATGTTKTATMTATSPVTPLPETGSSGPSLLLLSLGGAALIIVGLTARVAPASRRRSTP